MLQQLTIHNFGLIDKVILTFSDQLNILTGETGAGKSILIDALRSVLGERMDSSFIRDANQTCLIEAVFDIPKSLQSHPQLTDFITSDDTTLIIQRQLGQDGKSRIKVNGLTVTVGQLKSIGNTLIDFHGPHDHQMLLDDALHLDMLDKLIDFKNLKTSYQNIFDQYKKLTQELQSLTQLSQTRQRDLDFLSHQVKELESVPLTEDDYNSVMQEYVKIQNAERLHEHVHTLLGIMEDDQMGLQTILGKSFSPMRNINTIDDNTAPWSDQITLIQEHVNDLIGKLSNYADSLDFDPNHAAQINQTYDAYQDIKRKYGPTLEDARKLYEESRQKLDAIANFEHNHSHLNSQIESLKKDLTLAAGKITKLRQSAAGKLDKTVESELKELGIAHVRFETHFKTVDFNTDGCDQVIFYISPNAGEDLKPLADIVSSGEAARVMLALKKALIDADPIPVLIFDEIDAQIGGRLGTITGKKLKELSSKRQVILITHLPQIAAFAQTHFKVIKSVKASRALTEVLTLDDKQRVEELAQMMSGQSTTAVALSHAKDMLAIAKKS